MSSSPSKSMHLIEINFMQIIIYASYAYYIAYISIKRSIFYMKKKEGEKE